LSEELHLPEHGSREDIYRAILPQIEAVMAGVDDLIANLANVAAILKQAFDFHWVGFYRTTAPRMLMLGPFQGPPRLCEHPLRQRRLRRRRYESENGDRRSC